MKLKKLKHLLRCVNRLSGRKSEEIKGRYKTGQMLDANHPLVLIPTKGKYCLPEVREINHIIKSIEPDELVDVARKVNFQTRIQLISVFKHPQNPNYMEVLVHTPHGCCAYAAIIDAVDNKFTKEIKDKEIKISLADDMKDKFEIM